MSSAPLEVSSTPSFFAKVILAAIAVSGLAAAALFVADQRSAPLSGSPVVEFEIQLPQGILLPNDRNISVMLWNGNSGIGGKITQVRRSGDRPLVAGSFVAARTGDDRLSLQLSSYAHGYWKMPIGHRAPVDREFGSWQAIEFLPSPRAEEPPLPPGHYEVRYRVAKYI